MHVLLLCGLYVCTRAPNDCYHAPCRCKDFNLNTTPILPPHRWQMAPKRVLGSRRSFYIRYSVKPNDYTSCHAADGVPVHRQTNDSNEMYVICIRFDDNRVFNELEPPGSRRVKFTFVYGHSLRQPHPRRFRRKRFFRTVNRFGVGFLFFGDGRCITVP